MLRLIVYVARTDCVVQHPDQVEILALALAIASERVVRLPIGRRMMGIHVNMIYVSGEVDSDTAHNIAGLGYVDKRICPRSETRRSGNMTIFTLGCLRESGKLSIAV